MKFGCGADLKRHRSVGWGKAGFELCSEKSSERRINVESDPKRGRERNRSAIAGPDQCWAVIVSGYGY